MNILAIDTSCDETSVAITRDDRVLSNKIASQIELHKKWGGVVPGIARRMHEENIDLVIKDALKQVKMQISDLDAIAVTYGPGLAIALGVGIEKAKSLALEYNKPLIGVNHMEGHLYSALAHNSKGKPEIEYQFPLLALLISGKHTDLVLMRDHGKYEVLGRTLDDAIGEAFDKVGRMLEIGYPAGPFLEELAKEGNPLRFPLPVPMSKTHSADFSYSGLKTAALYLTNRELKERKDQLSSSEYKQIICDVACSFQIAATEALLMKTSFALKSLALENDICDLIVAGGVSANQYIRNKMRFKFGKKMRIHFPTEKKLYGDNAGMIGVAAYYIAQRGIFSNPTTLDRIPNLSF
ncbi:MAG: tRNA (adenosine(37)-N6)-threonylcarbamoyltransferase complex transferase subunit TsaD [bacterium]|nr:tRNA (adenosine(37)-N6)-threonylcarbamoyltransferase complex transferase subunit TsaD [bacterium]